MASKLNSAPNSGREHVTVAVGVPLAVPRAESPLPCLPVPHRGRRLFAFIGILSLVIVFEFALHTLVLPSGRYVVETFTQFRASDGAVYGTHLTTGLYNGQQVPIELTLSADGGAGGILLPDDADERLDAFGAAGSKKGIAIERAAAARNELMRAQRLRLAQRFKDLMPAKPAPIADRVPSALVPPAAPPLPAVAQAPALLGPVQYGAPPQSPQGVEEPDSGIAQLPRNEQQAPPPFQMGLPAPNVAPPAAAVPESGAVEAPGSGQHVVVVVPAPAAVAKPGNPADSFAPRPASGFDVGVIRHLHTELCGTSIEKTRRHPKVYGRPARLDRVPKLSALLDEAQAFQRIFGFLLVPAAGEYVFTLACGGECELFLEPMGALPVAIVSDVSYATRRASLFARVNSDRIVRYPPDMAAGVREASHPIHLEPGKYYAIDVVHKGVASSDSVGVLVRTARGDDSFREVPPGWLVHLAEEELVDDLNQRYFENWNIRALSGPAYVPGGRLRYPYREVQRAYTVFHLRTDVITGGALPTCIYDPSFVSQREVKKYTSPMLISTSAVFPPDMTAMANSKRPDPGSAVIPEDLALLVAQRVVDGLNIARGQRPSCMAASFQQPGVASEPPAIEKTLGDMAAARPWALDEVVRVHCKYDPQRGNMRCDADVAVHHLETKEKRRVHDVVVLDLGTVSAARMWMLERAKPPNEMGMFNSVSRRPNPNAVANSGAMCGVCRPANHEPNPRAFVHILVPLKNQGQWLQHLLGDLEDIQSLTGDTRFDLTIADFGSSDIDVEAALRNSRLNIKYRLVQLSGTFKRAGGLQAAYETLRNDRTTGLNDAERILFLCDLHLLFTPELLDSIRMHTVAGRLVFAPVVSRMECGECLVGGSGDTRTPPYSIAKGFNNTRPLNSAGHTTAPENVPQGYWELAGFGLMALYLRDFETVGGMNTDEYSDVRGGEDIDLLDRIVAKGFEVDRFRIPNFRHFFSGKQGLWERTTA